MADKVLLSSHHEVAEFSGNSLQGLEEVILMLRERNLQNGFLDSQLTNGDPERQQMGLELFPELPGRENFQGLAIRRSL